MAETEDSPQLAEAGEAERHFEAKDFAAALPLFAALSAAQPQNAQFAIRHAQCLLGLRHWPAARAAWQEIISRHGPNPARLSHMAQCCIELADYAGVAAFVAAYPDCLTAPTPSLCVFAGLAAVALGNIGEAENYVALSRILSPAQRESFFHHFNWRLAALGRAGHGAAALALLRLIIPGSEHPAPLLRTGLNLAKTLRQREEQRYYAQALIEHDLAQCIDFIEHAECLLEDGALARADDLLAALDEKFPPSGRSAAESRRILGLQVTRSGRPAWEQKLQALPHTDDFEAMNFRIAAHITLHRHEQALEMALAAAMRFGSHPWFMRLAAKCHERLGNWPQAMEYAARAIAQDPDFLLGYVELCRLQRQAGLQDDARATARLLQQKAPHLPVQWSLFNDPGPPPPPEVSASPAHHATWLHGGDSGDLIYALAAMRDIGGQLYLGCVDSTREPMIGGKIDFLRPLLEAQPYVHRVQPWQGEKIDMDFNLFRFLRHEEGSNLTAWHWRAVRGDAPDVTTPWLCVSGHTPHRRPVFARSQRYRAPGWEPFWAALKQAAPDAIFVGTYDEFLDFGHGEFHFAMDALELARMIAGASVFAGNQSLPYAIAEGLKIGRLLESHPDLPNCIFPGALPLSFAQARAYDAR